MPAARNIHQHLRGLPGDAALRFGTSQSYHRRIFSLTFN
jgi:hypothetical protein